MPHAYPRVQTTCAAMLAVFLLSVPLLEAQVQLSTLSDAQGASLGFGADSQNRVGFVFTTDAHSYALNSITANLFENNAGTVVAQLFAADGSAFPTGTSLGSFSYGAISASASNVVFTPTSAISLSASTEYVFVLTSTGVNSNYGWNTARGDAVISMPAGNTWLMPSGHDYSGDGGTSWALNSAPPFPGSALILPLVAVDATITAVPEPSATAVMSGGLSLLVLLAWRRFSRGTV